MDFHHSDVIDTGGLDTINDTHHTHNVSMQSGDTVAMAANLQHHHTFNFPTHTETENISHTHVITGNTDNESLSHNHTIENFSSTYYDHSHDHVIDVSMGLWPGENRVDYPNPIKIKNSTIILLFILYNENCKLKIKYIYILWLLPDFMMMNVEYKNIWKKHKYRKL